MKSYLFALSLFAFACGDTKDATNETDAGGVPDSGTVADSGTVDAGPIVPRPDAGPTGCTEGCAIEEIGVGSSHACARRENGTVVCWGSNNFGELGDGSSRHQDCSNSGSSDRWDCSTSPVVAYDVVASSLAINGSSASCALTETNTPVCWGSVPAEENIMRRYDPLALTEVETVAGVSRGAHSTCVVNEDGTASCWGANFAGQLGYGGTADSYVELQTVLSVDGKGTLDNVDELSLGVGFGGSTTCARIGGDLTCWGANDAGQLGDGVLEHSRCGSGPSIYDCSFEPVAVADLNEVTQFSVGSKQVCARTEDGAAYCWGANYYGQLGLGDTASHTTPTLLFKAGIEEVRASSGFGCVRKDDGTVWCFGAGGDGQLGDGAGSHQNCDYDSELTDCSPAPVQVEGLTDATAIALGGAHACALRATGDVVCWGSNQRAQLGTGNRDNALSPVAVVGLDEAE